MKRIKELSDKYVGDLALVHWLMSVMLGLVFIADAPTENLWAVAIVLLMPIVIVPMGLISGHIKIDWSRFKKKDKAPDAAE